jgi:hypothetical protein
MQKHYLLFDQNGNSDILSDGGWGGRKEREKKKGAALPLLSSFLPSQ